MSGELLVEVLTDLLCHDKNTMYYDAPSAGRSAAKRYAETIMERI